jgi:Secretion system C-terminal sorting domain
MQYSNRSHNIQFMKNKFLSFTVTAIVVLHACIFISSCSLVKDKEEYKEEEREREEGENEEDEREETGADKQLSSWFWAKGYPDPSNLSKKYEQGWKQHLELAENTKRNFGYYKSRTAAMGNWVDIGPKVFGGRILSLAISPTAASSGNNTIFAGSASGGIWKSYTNGLGATAWQPVTTGFPVLGVASIVYHPTDSMILLAGTGEVYRVDTVVNGANSANQVGNTGRNVWKTRGTYGIGILRSVNGGSTWSQVVIQDTQALAGIQRIKFDPTNATIVYACSTDGVFKSTNTGASFTKILALTNVRDIVIDPANNQKILISAGNLDRTDKGLWRSTDGGTSFTKLSGGGFPTAAQYKGYVTLTIAGTAAPYTIFAGVGKGDITTANSYGNETEVYTSTDFGTNWTAISMASGSSDHASYQAWYSHCITPHPVAGGTSTSRIFAAGVNKYLFTLSGTWTKTSIGTGATNSGYLAPGAQEGTNYVHADVHDIQFIPGSTTTAYFATDGGIFRTTNANGAANGFVSCNGGLQVQQFYAPSAQSRTNPGLFVGGLQDNNVIRSRGTSWAKVIGGDGGPCLFKPGAEGTLLGSTDTRGVQQSTDSGSTYGANVLTYLGSLSTPNDDRTSFMAPMAVSEANTARWYVGSDNIHISINSGGTFTGSGVPGTSYIEALHKPAVAIGVSDANALKLYASVSPFAQNTSSWGLFYTPPANIRKSTDGGTSFTTVTNGLPDRLYTDFAISKTFDDSVFVTLGGFGVTHIYVSGNGGSTWTPRGTGLPDVPFNTILIDSANRNILYAGSDFGVYVSPDRGANWYDFSGGLWDATYVMDLVFAPGNKIRAVTHGKGIFETARWNGLVTLPVYFNSFTAVNKGSYNELKWIVDQESNLSHYEVERSIDGFNYRVIKQVMARNSAVQTTYVANEYIGTNPAPVYYYRIKSVDRDGSYSYTDVIAVRISTKAKFEVLGNPFNNSLTMRYTVPQTGKLQISLVDMQGRVMRKEQLIASTGTGTYTINNLSALTAGTYLLNFEINNTRTTIKVLKQ